jgi:hypothetical protein
MLQKCSLALGRQKCNLLIYKQYVSNLVCIKVVTIFTFCILKYVYQFHKYDCGQSE